MSHLVHGINYEHEDCWFLGGDLLSAGDTVEVLISGEWEKAKVELAGKQAFVLAGNEKIEIDPFYDVQLRWTKD